MPFGRVITYKIIHPALELLPGLWRGGIGAKELKPVGKTSYLLRVGIIIFVSGMPCFLILIDRFKPLKNNSTVSEVDGVAALEIIPDLFGRLSLVLYEEGGEVAQLFYYPCLIVTFDLKGLWLTRLYCKMTGMERDDK